MSRAVNVCGVMLSDYGKIIGIAVKDFIKNGISMVSLADFVNNALESDILEVTSLGIKIKDRDKFDKCLAVYGSGLNCRIVPTKSLFADVSSVANNVVGVTIQDMHNNQEMQLSLDDLKAFANCFRLTYSIDDTLLGEGRLNNAEIIDMTDRVLKGELKGLVTPEEYKAITVVNVGSVINTLDNMENSVKVQPTGAMEVQTQPTGVQSDNQFIGMNTINTEAQTTNNAENTSTQSVGATNNVENTSTQSVGATNTQDTSTNTQSKAVHTTNNIENLSTQNIDTLDDNGSSMESMGNGYITDVNTENYTIHSGYEAYNYTRFEGNHTSLRFVDGCDKQSYVFGKFGDNAPVKMCGMPFTLGEMVYSDRKMNVNIRTYLCGTYKSMPVYSERLFSVSKHRANMKTVVTSKGSANNHATHTQMITTLGRDSEYPVDKQGNVQERLVANKNNILTINDIEGFTLGIEAFKLILKYLRNEYKVRLSVIMDTVSTFPSMCYGNIDVALAKEMYAIGIDPYNGLYLEDRSNETKSQRMRMSDDTVSSIIYTDDVEVRYYISKYQADKVRVADIYNGEYGGLGTEMLFKLGEKYNNINGTDVRALSELMTDIRKYELLINANRKDIWLHKMALMQANDYKSFILPNKNEWDTVRGVYECASSKLGLRVSIKNTELADTVYNI